VSTTDDRSGRARRAARARPVSRQVGGGGDHAVLAALAVEEDHHAVRAVLGGVGPVVLPPELHAVALAGAGVEHELHERPGPDREVAQRLDLGGENRSNTFFGGGLSAGTTSNGFTSARLVILAHL
jgi:hypothetical protein